MTPETEVIACPACKHLVRVPLDWLGTQVQCPECKAMFRAPVRADGKLTDAELLSRPAPATAAAPRKLDTMLLMPAFGLLLCGVAGALVNAGLLYFLLTDRTGGKEWGGKQVEAMRKMGVGQAEQPEKQPAKDEKETEDLVRLMRWVLPLSLTVSLVVFFGGLSIVFRRGYRFAQFSCVLAALNLAHGCCIPGAVFGLWGLLMLNSDEAREHFTR